MTDAFLQDLTAYRLPLHLVLDGARVVNLGGADIADRLREHRLIGRPLFRETAHRPTVLAGPWLVSLGTNYPATQRGLAVSREIGKGVFWLGEPDSEVLFLHLRRLGAARLPTGSIRYFRHYDSDVLAAIVPLANAEQAAYLFGPTKVIAFIGGSGDGATVERPEALPNPGPGPIAFEQWQIDELDERQRQISRRKVADMLRSEFSDRLRPLSDREILERVRTHEKDAKQIGLVSEDGIAKWSFLCEYTSKEVNSNKPLIAYLKRSGSSVDRELEINMENIIVEYDFKKLIENKEP